MISKIREMVKGLKQDTFYQEYNENYWVRLNNDEIQLLEDLLYEDIKSNPDYAYDSSKDWIRDLFDKLERAGNEDE